MQTHKSIPKVRDKSGNDPFISGDKRVEWDEQVGNVDIEGGGLKRNYNKRSALLHPPKKRRLSSAGEKFPLKCVKRRRSSSRSFTDDRTEIEPELDISSYAPAKLCRTLILLPASSPFSLLNGREKELNPSKRREGTKARCGLLSRTANIYGQQHWEGEILQERDVKQERGIYQVSSKFGEDSPPSCQPLPNCGQRVFHLTFICSSIRLLVYANKVKPWQIGTL